MTVAPNGLGGYGGQPRRIVIEHRTGYRYEKPVLASYNEARLTPITTIGQTALDARVEVSRMTWTHTYWDYWGTQVTAFDVLTPHETLEVVASSTVEVWPSREVNATATWDDVRSDAVTDEWVEFLGQSRSTTPDDELVDLAHEVSSGLSPDAAARAICERINGLVEYVPGVTSVHTDAVEVWRTKQGVCQDYTHLTLGALRSVGIPARYVSGYLHPQPDAALGETVEGQSHAWVEWWAGEWVAFDPTHAAPAGADHVVVARGRNYGDVPPLKGVYAGTAGSELFVSVKLTRLS
ncbi:transglutaminase family protein [Kineosporia sp. R_H_3]|uniref:transglutaminase family protein n=1 Tax=Kineosporia sp. R_H_3 TaxID=1961848 RepID=UPI0018E96713|nr:transglutaminase family protein [Kineosporia sp. R_H_3]